MKKKSILSQAIYLDTNALRQFAFSVSNVEFSELKYLSDQIGAKLFSPMVAVKEFIKHWQKETIGRLEKINKTARELGRLLDREPIDFEKPHDIENQIIQKINNNLELAGIKIIETPEIALETLIEMAINRIPPFEEKKEKGFRDSVILFSILDHIERDDVSNAVFISGDNIFTNDNIIHLFEEKNCIISISKNLSEAGRLIEEQIGHAFSLKLKREKDTVVTFLKNNFEQIYSFVLANAEVSEYYLKGSGSTEEDNVASDAKIKRILNVQPINISDVSFERTWLKDPVPEGRKGLIFSVLTEFDLLVERYELGILFDQPKVKLASPMGFDELEYRYHKPKIYQVRINKNISVDAHYEEIDGVPTNLELLRVLTY